MIYYDRNLLSYNTNRLDPASFPPLYATSIKTAYELVKNYDVMVALDKFIDYVGEGLYMELGVYDKSSHYFPRPDHQYHPQTGKEVYIKLADCATCYAAGDIYLTRYFKLPQIFEDVFEPSDFDLSVKWTKRQQFRDLENILMERYSLPETMKGVISWIVLVEACFKRYHDRWIEQYDSNELKISNIEEYIKFCYDGAILTTKDIKAHQLLTFYWLYETQPGFKNINSLTFIAQIEFLLNECEKEAKKQGLEKLLFAHKERDNTRKPISLEEIDLMSGIEFEQFIAKLFKKSGYNVELTSASGDQGIDIIASRGIHKIGIQAKRYSGSVGNSAVQEVVAGQKYYGLTKTIVVTNSRFTRSAYSLAEKNNVVLWDREMLKLKVEEYNSKL